NYGRVVPVRLDFGRNLNLKLVRRYGKYGSLSCAYQDSNLVEDERQRRTLGLLIRIGQASAPHLRDRSRGKGRSRRWIRITENSFEGECGRLIWDPFPESDSKVGAETGRCRHSHNSNLRSRCAWAPGRGVEAHLRIREF